MLFGHSWGAYSVGNVLNLHPEVAGAVIVAGFNESEDLMLNYSGKVFGPFAEGLMTYVEAYERVKFGKKVTKISTIDGLKKTDAQIMIVHSKDDKVVPTDYGYDKFYEEFKDNERFTFVLYEDRGHNHPYYSKQAWEYQKNLNKSYHEYLKKYKKKNNKKSRLDYMKNHLDKKKCYEPDGELMDRIIKMYDKGAEIKKTKTNT
jgi:dipeptidyl aminopeptidase/acylaminoacyl peptidase